MSTGPSSEPLAQQGLLQIESAIVELLRRNPQGLRNVQIAQMLGLRSVVRGGQRNYLTYSVLGGLLVQDRITWDADSKLYLSLDADRTVQAGAQEGLREIENAVLELLGGHPEGLRNVDIADRLNLRSMVRGGRRNYLTFSILGGLLADGKIAWNQDTKVYTRL